MDTILVMDKDSTWRSWVRSALEVAGIKAWLIEISTDEDMPHILQNCDVDLLMADSTHLAKSALDIIQTTREHSPKTKVVLFTPSAPREMVSRTGMLMLESAYLVPKEQAVREIGSIVQDLLKA